jgi:HSP20 family protein
MIIRRLGNWPTWGLTNPFEELERIRRDMDRIIAGAPGRAFGQPTAGVFPFVNLTEDKDNYYVRAELPGIETGGLDISATADSLSLSGERKLSEEDKNARYHRREREAGRFSRVIALPTGIDTGKVEARSNDGVLTVVLPKSEAAKPRQITIKTA